MPINNEIVEEEERTLTVEMEMKEKEDNGVRRFSYSDLV